MKSTTTLFIAIFTVAASIGLVGHIQSASAASSQINAQICGGLVALSINSPVDNSVTVSNNLVISTTSSWADSLTISGSGNAPVTKTLSNSANYNTTTNITLTPGTHTLTITAHGDCPTGASVTRTLTVTHNPNGVTIDPIVTNNRSPLLAGRTLNTSAVMSLRVTWTDANGDPQTLGDYNPVINADGTWELPAGTITPDLVDGKYNVRVMTKTNPGDTTYLTDDTFSFAITIDTVAPTGTIDPISSDSRSPGLTGTVNDPNAIVTVTINGRTYTAVNEGNGRWHLPQGVLSDLASGSYTIEATFTDRASNSTRSTASLTIQAPNEIGFILAPNTGYLRIGTVNLYSFYLYLGLVAAIIFVVRRRMAHLKTLHARAMHAHFKYKTVRKPRHKTKTKTA